MSGWYGEVLFRQGTWVTTHETESQATRWVLGVLINEHSTANPPRRFHVRRFQTSNRIPQPPALTFDEAWPAPPPPATV